MAIQIHIVNPAELQDIIRSRIFFGRITEMIIDTIFPFHNNLKAPLLFDVGLLCLLLADLSKIFVPVSLANK